MKMIKRIKLLSLVALFIGQIYATRITTRPIVAGELQPDVQAIVDSSIASLDKADMLTVRNSLIIPRNCGAAAGTAGVVPGTAIPVPAIQGARDIDGDVPVLRESTDARIRETFIKPYQGEIGKKILRVFQIYDRLHSTPLATSKIVDGFAVVPATHNINPANVLLLQGAVLGAPDTLAVPAHGLLGFIANYNAMPGANIMEDLETLTGFARKIHATHTGAVDKKLKVVKAFLDYTVRGPQPVTAAAALHPGVPIVGSYAEAIGAIIRGDTIPSSIIAKGNLVECVTDFITALAADVSIAPLTPMEMIVGRAGAVHPIRGIGHRFTPVLASLFCELFTLGAYDADGNCHGGCDYLMRYNVKLIDTLDPLGAAAHVTTGANPSIAANNRIFQAEVALRNIQLSEGVLVEDPLQWINSPAMLAPNATGRAVIVPAAPHNPAVLDVTNVHHVFDGDNFPGATFVTGVPAANQLAIRQLQVCVTGTKLLFNVGSLVNYMQGQKLPKTTQFSLAAATAAVALPTPAIPAAPRAVPPVVPTPANTPGPAVLNNICLPNFIKINTGAAIVFDSDPDDNHIFKAGYTNLMPLRVIYQAMATFGAPTAHAALDTGSMPEFFGIGYEKGVVPAAQVVANKAIRVLSRILPMSVRLDPANLNRMLPIGDGTTYPGGAGAVVKTGYGANFMNATKPKETTLADI